MPRSGGLCRAVGASSEAPCFGAVRGQVGWDPGGVVGWLAAGPPPGAAAGWASRAFSDSSRAMTELDPSELVMCSP